MSKMARAAPSGKGADADAAPLRRQLLAWYDRHRRDLPWRAAAGVAPDPYHVLLSELMLQQTTVATVRGRFDAFLQRFPDLAALAAADETDVLHAWQGLGYYRRARALHAAARCVVADHGGSLPEDPAALLALPGVGPYTARAIAAIAFARPTVPADGNVRRVMARLHRVMTPLPAAAAELDRLAMRLAGAARPGDLAQALMDLGATVCRPRAPRCEVCPWRTACRARGAGDAERLPARAPKRARPLQRGLAFFLVRRDGHILFRRRAEQGPLFGLHELPCSPWREGALDVAAGLAHAPVEAAWQLDGEPVRHGFTHLTLELTLARAQTTAPPEGLWCGPDALDRLTLPSLTRKLLRRAAVLDAHPPTVANGAGSV